MIIDQIVAYHRQNRFMIKMQSRIDRSMEAYVRTYVFGFSPMLSEEARKEITKKTTALMKQCRAGTAPAEYADIAEMVVLSDASRESWDILRGQRERALEKLAKQLPGADFVKSVPGVGMLGFAQIIGETGDLSNYADKGKVWKRLGLAPYEGFAMSTWMRASWRPYALKEEWTDESLGLFWKAERYAIVAMIAQFLWMKQWTGKEKAPPDGEPNGPYGEIYARRRAHTSFTHAGEDAWTPMHSHKDALRYMFKTFIRDLHREWRRARPELTERSIVVVPAVSSISQSIASRYGDAI